MTGLTVLAVLESTSPPFACRTKYSTVILTVLAVSAVMVISFMTATPLKLNPPFP